MAGIGFGPFLEAIGAGIGQGVEQINRQKQQQQQLELQKMAALRDNLMLQQFLRKQQQDQALAGYVPPAAGGAAGTPSGGYGGQTGYARLEPPGSPYVASGPDLVAGGAAGRIPGGGQYAKPGGGYGSGLTVPQLTQLAQQYGFKDPATAAAVFEAESSGNPFAENRTPKEDSVGLPQINLYAHPQYTREGLMGNIDAQMRAALDVSKGGTDFSPWSVYKSGAYRSYLQPQANAPVPQGGAPPQEGGAAPPAGDPTVSHQVSPNLYWDAKAHQLQRGALPQGAQMPGPGGTLVDQDTGQPLSGGAPGLAGASNRPPVNQVAQNNAGPPTANDAGGMPELINVEKHYNDTIADMQSKGIPPGSPGARAILAQQRQIDTATNSMRLQMARIAEEHRARQQTAANNAARLEIERQRLSREGLKFERLPDGTVKEWHPGEPIVPGATITAEAPAPGAGKAEKFGSIDDLMSRWHQDFVGKEKREPTTDEIAAQRQALQGQIKPTGGRTQQMTQRLMIGANEVNKAVTALTQLPMGTTLGWFGGAQAAQGEGLAENVKKSLANAVTPQSSQILKALSNGVSRGLAILESGGSAQGLVGLSKQLQNDLPQENDTGLTIAAKFADIRQIVEAATEVLGTSELSKDQKALIKNIESSVQKAVPFTTTDVAKLAGNPSDETITQFAQKAGLVKDAGPKPGTVEEGHRFKGGDPADPSNWEKVQ